MIKKSFLIFFLILTSANAYSSEKIITVDIDYIINNSEAGVFIQDQLKDKNDNRVKEFEIKNKEFANKEQNLIAKKNVLSEKDFENEVNSLRKEINIFNNINKKKIEDINNKRSKAFSKLINEINKILIEYSKKNEVLMILDKKNILLSKNDIDLTQEILKRLNNKITKISIE